MNYGERFNTTAERLLKIEESMKNRVLMFTPIGADEFHLCCTDRRVIALPNCSVKNSNHCGGLKNYFII